jgi:glyceraldehyde 3-phosphate dehydrogenase
VADGSVTDLVATLSRDVTVDEVNAGPPPPAVRWRVCSCTPRTPSCPAMSWGSPASRIFDAPLTLVMGKPGQGAGLVRHEWGYTSRLVDLVTIIGGARG